MTKTQHLQFLVLMIPTFILLIAAAVSMADLAIPAPMPQTYAMAPDAVWDDRPVQ
jgi:hypothetical protein